MDSFEKQPSEKFSISIDFSNNLSTDETISTYTVTAYLNDNDITSAVVFDHSQDNEGKIIYIKPFNGVNGLDYKITIIIVTTDSNIFEKDVLMRVREV